MRTRPHTSASARIGIAAVLVALVLLPLRALAGDYDRWYTVEMFGTRAGYMHSYQKTENGQITSASSMVIELRRASSSVSMTVEGVFVETEAGKPVSMRSVQKLATTPKVSEYTFGEKEIAFTITEGDQKRSGTRPLPEGTWLTPAAATEYVAQRLKAEADKIVVRTIDPLSGPDAEVLTLSGMQRTTVEAMGKTVPAIKCVSTSTAVKGVSQTEYLDESGIPIRSQVSLGPIALTVVVSDKAAALAKNAGGGGEIPELMVKTFITPDKPVAHPRKARKAVFLLSVPDGAMPELPTTGVQRVAKASEQSSRVAIGGEPVAAPEEDAKNEAYLASTSMLRHDDPEVRKLAEKATAGMGPEKPARAEAMRKFVEKYVKTKDLDVGFASASEVARTRHGDCSEHGVLLAALLRADGIPARVVSGLVYVESAEGASGGIFGYHMWAQALLERDGKHVWVDLDGTLPGPRAFDATHIALATSALGEGEEATSLATILPLMGRLSIKVESAE